MLSSIERQVTYDEAIPMGIAAGAITGLVKIW